MAIEKTTVQTNQSRKTAKRDYHYAVGRQKESVARVRLYTSVKDGQIWGASSVSKDMILVNALPIERYFPGDLARAHYEEPLKVTGTLQKYAFTVKVSGGGSNGQLDAVVKGISRVLAALDRDKMRSVLKKKGLLTRDSRVRERRKVGTGGKARRQKQSPKR